jgi:LacI family transcriptional regulator
MVAVSTYFARGGDAGDGLSAALQQPALPGVELTVTMTSDATVAAGRRAARELVRLVVHSRPTAVVRGTDAIAVGLVHELANRGVRVPEDVAVVGYGDRDYAAAASVPLSSVRLCGDVLGRTAAHVLPGEVNDGRGQRHRQLVVERELVVPGSSWAAGHTRLQ